MAQRKTEGQWIDGKWVTTSIGAAEGSGDTSATTKAKFQDVSGLAAASRRAKKKREATAGDAAEALARRKKEKEREY